MWGADASSFVFWPCVDQDLGRQQPVCASTMYFEERVDFRQSNSSPPVAPEPKDQARRERRNDQPHYRL